MGAAIGEILPLAIGVAISPIPIIAIVLMLASPRGKASAWGFLIGWLAGLTLVGVIVLLVADPAGASGVDGPSTWVGWLVVVLGVFLVISGVRSFLVRPRGGEEPSLPKWLAAFDGLSFGKSFALGVAGATASPKNLPLALAAAAAIAGAGLTGVDAYVVLGAFVLIGTLGLILPILVYYLGGDRSSEVLGDLNHWLAANNTAIMAVLFVVIGAKLVGSGLQTLLA